MAQYKDKCDAEGCCIHLLNRLTDSGRGFHSVDTVILSEQKTGPATMHFRGVSYKTNAKDKGSMLNWCPFCGGQPGDFKRA